jgi:hypothetical protein
MIGTTGFVRMMFVAGGTEDGLFVIKVVVQIAMCEIDFFGDLVHG